MTTESDFNDVLSECCRAINAVARDLCVTADALDAVGLERPAATLFDSIERLSTIDARLSKAYGAKVSRDLKESQRMVGGILSSLLRASENPRRVRNAVLVGGLVVAEGDDVTPPDWPGRHGRDRGSAAETRVGE